MNLQYMFIRRGLCGVFVIKLVYCKGEIVVSYILIRKWLVLDNLILEIGLKTLKLFCGVELKWNEMEWISPRRCRGVVLFLYKFNCSPFIHNEQV